MTFRHLAEVFVLIGAATLPGFGGVNPTTSPDVFYIAGTTTKLRQLIGDTDYQWRTPTDDLTLTRAGISGTDLGISFVHNGVTYVLFGDTQGALTGARDPIATTTDTDPEERSRLTFYTDGAVFHPITIPGVADGAYDTPLDGASASNRMYLYYTTDHSPTTTNRQSLVAVSTNNGWTFGFLYTLSTTNFIAVSVNQVNSTDWPGVPQSAGEGLLIFGSGAYRASNVRLAFQPASGIEDPSTLRYFTGLDGSGNPLWSADESAGIDLFSQPVVGELSVAYNKFIRRWLLLYNSLDAHRGINFRTALQPWGPWSETQVLLGPWVDQAYGYYQHVNWDSSILDNVQYPGGENIWGGEYGPYMFKEWATGSDNQTTVYFTLSTWNPYVSLLMRTELVVTNSPTITLNPADQEAMAGQSTTFQVLASAVGPLDYLWTRNNLPILGATNSILAVSNVNSADNGAVFACQVTNAVGTVTSRVARLTVVLVNQAPVPRIVTPLPGLTYAAGDTIAFTGSATDPEDGALPPSALSWNVFFCHGNHNVHFLGTSSGVAGGSWTVPTRGESGTNVFFRIYLTARDSGGRESTVFRDVTPRTSTLTLETEPAGLTVTLNGQPMAAPTNVSTVVGSTSTVGLTGSVNAGGRDRDFMAWSDSGAPNHFLSMPSSNLTLRADFRVPTVLVPTNAPWRYWVGTNSPAGAWKDASYDDAGWPSGTAPLGYGGSGLATVIGWGPDPTNRYRTTYFRHSFEVVNPAGFASLLVRWFRNAGGVAYLNGTEVLRHNLGGGAPIHQMLAPAASDDSSIYITNLPTALLLPGTNILAAEIHLNQVGNSALLGFGLELRGVEPDPRLTVTKQDTSLALAWPAPSPNWVLESASALGGTSNWTPVNRPVVVTNGENQLLLPPLGNTLFFRLAEP
jgi:hypothetical protein